MKILILRAKQHIVLSVDKAVLYLLFIHDLLKTYFFGKSPDKTSQERKYLILFFIFISDIYYQLTHTKK